MNTNVLPSEVASVVGTIDPDAYTANPYSTAWVKADDFHAYLAIVQAGDLGSSATLNAKIEQAQTDGGTPKDVTGTAITALTQAGSDSNKQALINVRPEDLDIANGYAWLRLTITVAVATSDAGGLLLGFYPRSGLATANDASAVDEVKTA